MTLANSFAAKLSVAFVAFATAFVLAVPAQAAEMTDAEMEAEIARLTALIEGLTTTLGGDAMGGSMSSSTVCPYSWTRSLSVGDSGADVMMLQKFLNSDPMTRVAATGVGSAGMETEYYGGLTGAAVAKFQEANRAAILSPLGLVNSTTFFGPSTMAEANAQCASAPVVADDTVADDTTTDDTTSDDDDTTSTATLGSDEGDIDSVSSKPSDTSNLEEGGDAEGILGFELEIDGDVEVDRMDFFIAEDGSDSDDAEDYFASASLWMDGEMIAEIDVDDFDQDDYNELSLASDDYRLRFSGLELVFTDGDEPEFQLALEPVNNIDSGDLTADWDAGLESIRFVDGQGFTDTWSDTALPLATIADTFGFDAEETAELDVSTDDDDINDARTLEVDTDDDSSEIDVFSFEIEEENGVDTTLIDLRVTLTALSSTSAALAENVVVEEAILYHNGSEVGSDSPSATGVVDFENIDVELAADATEAFVVALVFKGTDDYGEGATVATAFTSVVDAEDANGNDQSDMTITGTPASDAHTLRSEGATVTLTDSDTDTKDTNGDTAGGEQGLYTLEFDVTAFGEDLYVPKGATVSTSSIDTDDGIAFVMLDSNDDQLVSLNGGAGTASTSFSVTSDANTSGAYYVVDSGSTESFTLDVTFTAITDGFYRAQLHSVNFNAGSAAAADARELATPAEDFDTAAIDLDV